MWVTFGSICHYTQQKLYLSQCLLKEGTEIESYPSASLQRSEEADAAYQFDLGCCIRRPYEGFHRMIPNSRNPPGYLNWIADVGLDDTPPQVQNGFALLEMPLDIQRKEEYNKGCPFPFSWGYRMETGMQVCDQKCFCLWPQRKQSQSWSQFSLCLES